MNEYIPWIGFSSKAILDKILLNYKKLTLTKTQKTEIITLKKQIYHEKKKANNQPILPAVNFLKDLINKKHSYGIKIGIVSSAPRQEILYNLQLIGIDSSKLDGITSGSDDLADIHDSTGTNKPKPYIYQKIANILNIKPKSTVVFGDTQAGVNAAFAAGMRVYAVPNIYTKQHDFINSYAIIEFGIKVEQEANTLLQTGYFVSKSRTSN